MTESSNLGTQHARAVIDNGALGTREITFSTGRLARQAAGTAVAQLGDTVVLSATTAGKHPKEHFDFFPLTVDVEERMYAAGRIPGSFFRREGRPSEDAILTCRLIDRPLRPLFPDGFYNEVQVIIHVLSSNPEVDSDIPAMIGASAAIALSGIPFNGPIGACRVGYIDGQYVLNPNASQLPQSKLDLVVAGTDGAVMMVESEAKQLPEDVMLGAVVSAVTASADHTEPTSSAARIAAIVRTMMPATARP